MKKLREWLRILGALIVAAGAVVIGLVISRARRLREKQDIGEVHQNAEDAKEELKRAEETGDIEAVLREWRKHR